MSELMDYNTTRTHLKLPEYGRNVQKMVDFLKSITDKEERSKQAEVVVKTMLQIMSGYRDNDEFREKVWHHLYLMADYDIDIDCPYEITRENSKAVVLEKLEYNQKGKILTSYGRIIKEFIEEAIRYDGTDEEKFPVVLAIANQMKKIYVLWHKDYVADKVIIEDIKRLSGGKLHLPEGTELVNAKDFVPRNTPTNTRPSAKGKRTTGGRSSSGRSSGGRPSPRQHQSNRNTNNSGGSSRMKFS